PSKNQWRQFLKILSKKERKVFFVFFLMATFGFISLVTDFYLSHTKIAPAQGGTYVEGIVRSPRFINPIYAVIDVERDLTELIYSGLMKYDENGNIVPDLVERYEILEGGRLFEFYLREDNFWSDGKPLTAEDVLFTIKTIQNPSIKSPVRANWLGVKVEKISEYAIRFELSNSSATFVENSVQKIIPKHIWEDISYQNFPLSIYNQKPIGSGPYKIKELSQDSQGNIKSAELIINAGYTGQKPNISELKFLFFDNEEDAAKSLKNGEIDGLTFSSPKIYQGINKKDFSEYFLSLPRYFTVFLNAEESEILNNKEIRKALNYATNKDILVQETLMGLGSVIQSPILPEIYGFNQPENYFSYDIKKAKQILEDQGYLVGEDGIRKKEFEKKPAFQFTRNLSINSTGNEVSELQKCLAKDTEVYPDGIISGLFGSKTKAAVIKFQEKYKSEILTPNKLTAGNGKVLTSTRKKLNELCAATSQETLTLSFLLITVEQETLVAVANSLKDQWKEIGVELNIKTYEGISLEQDIIKPRNYEMLLFGEVLGFIPDPFPFWHSSQVSDPGLNLAGYKSKESDKLLEDNRQSMNGTERKEKLESFQEIIISDAPAVFLYSPQYLYLVSKDVKGLTDKIITDSSKRFSLIETWYIKTKRVWK
ncbi:MAG: ABC transporter substrate-binding protein, partial [Candidatus Nealsonbacteria bacterium]